ncbi:hypothetical protein [Peribacillus butanolivorans]|uniref:hypothetical protein n=1 Tax=Peribacillus butanolivorans TaxID=421767 RepID=UPI003671BC3A
MKKEDEVMKQNGEINELVKNQKDKNTEEKIDMNEMKFVITKEDWEMGKRMLEEKIKKNPNHLWESVLEDEVMILGGHLSEIEEKINELSCCISTIGLVGELLSIQEDLEVLYEVLEYDDKNEDDLMKIEFALPSISEDIEELELRVDAKFDI